MGRSDWEVHLPPLSEQAEIVARIGEMTDRYETFTTDAQRAIDLPRERRTALISAAVTGQINVRDAVAA